MFALDVLLLVPILGLPIGFALGLTPLLVGKFAGRPAGLCYGIALGFVAAYVAFLGYNNLTWVDPTPDEVLAECIWCGLAKLIFAAEGALQICLALGIAFGLFLSKWRPTISRSRSLKDEVLDNIGGRNQP